MHFIDIHASTKCMSSALDVSLMLRPKFTTVRFLHVTVTLLVSFSKHGGQGSAVYHIVYKGCYPIIGSEELYCSHTAFLVSQEK